jgi:hypothetical protein
MVAMVAVEEGTMYRKRGECNTMSIIVSVTRQKEGYLYIKAKGNYSLIAAKTVIDRVLAESLLNYKNILLDITEVIGTIPDIDRFLLGEYASTCWKHPLRVALVGRAETINKYFENVAVNRFVWTIAVPDVPTALNWLIEKSVNDKEPQ